MSGLSRLLCTGAVVLSLWLTPVVRAQVPDPTINWIFKSRPDLSPPRLNVSVNEADATPGYIFMGPYQAAQNAAVIYAADGSVIWSGYGTAGTGNAHDFRVCTYNSTDHLCVFTGVQYLGYARGQALIIDDTYKVVQSVQSVNGLSAMDQHEFVIVNNSALGIIYHPERYDLSNYMISTGEGWIQNCYFQEIDIDTNELLFEWSAIEHVGLNESFVTAGSSEVAGSGFDFTSPWDYFHMNSVDKNDEGDYLISARHTSTLYKISGKDGSVVWRCGGVLSDFDFEPGLNWSYQHDARWHSYNSTTAIISLFDNASNGFNTTANHSSSMIIALDLEATPRPYVRLLKSFPGPQGVPISASQGNTQLLSGIGNNDDSWQTSPVFSGWGSQPYVTEYDSSGRLTYQANIAANGEMNYRAYKFNWTSNPTDQPALYTYAQNTDANASTYFYMSWNGATAVASWRIYGKSSCGDNNDNGWSLIQDSVAKSGFETVYEASGYHEIGMVEAVGADGTGLRNSTSRGIRAFVPSFRLASVCQAGGCNNVTAYDGGVQRPMALNLADGPPATRAGCAVVSKAASTAEASSGPGGSADTENAASAVSLGSSGYTLLSVIMVLSGLLLSM